MTEPINDTRLIEAIDRIARTPDGRSLYLFLQRRMMAVCTSEEASALYRSEGERTFAARLIGLMATGMAESGGRTSSSGGTGGDTEQPIVFAVPKPVAVGGPRGAGRRITEHTRVPGWDAPESDAG
ncbi:MAG: hypothetical protein JWN43_3428 [Gammaproteobacteria bacterium]|nr:hypothetical protein [Gammaproteobacteria bacterium]